MAKNMESIQLNISGMKCGGCVSTVEKILNNSDGIENVSVNLPVSYTHLTLPTILLV